LSLGVSCPYGERCTQAHSAEELEEWKEYFEQWKARLQSEADKQDDCQAAEQLMEKWMSAEHPEAVVSLHILSYVCFDRDFLSPVTGGNPWSQLPPEITQVLTPY